MTQVVIRARMLWRVLTMPHLMLISLSHAGPVGPPHAKASWLGMDEERAMAVARKYLRRISAIQRRLARMESEFEIEATLVEIEGTLSL